MPDSPRLVLFLTAASLLAIAAGREFDLPPFFSGGRGRSSGRFMIGLGTYLAGHQ